MNLSLDRIVAGENVRTVPPPPEADQGLTLSIRHSGVLQPILVRPRPNRGIGSPGEVAPIPVNGNGEFEIVLGSRRVRCARDAGLTEIPAEVRDMTDAEARAAQAAENIQRAAMHPVDQWLAVKHLVETDGLTIAQAGGALGLDDRTIRRTELLGRLNPTVLELCKIEMPTRAELSTIARATPKAQIAAVKQHGRITQAHGQDQVYWPGIAQACRVDRISRTLALFDADSSGLAWDEDLFAQPGSPEQFTTSDVAGFMERQRTALNQRVAALTAAKKRVRVIPTDKNGFASVPKWFERTYLPSLEPGADPFDLPTKLGRHEWVLFVIGDDGGIKRLTAIDLQSAKAEEKQKADKAKQKAKGKTAKESTNNDQANDEGKGTAAEPVEDDAPAALEKDTPSGLTKEGLKLLAAAKTAALHEALLKQDRDPHDLLLMFIFAMRADNVQIRGAGGYRPFDDLIASLLLPGGAIPDLDDREIRNAAAQALSRILSIGDAYSASGHAAEWIGRLIDAKGYLGRFDSLPFLEQCKGPALRAAAESGQVKWSGTAADMRKRLAGNAPDWRPEAAVYGAPAPVAKREAA